MSESKKQIDQLSWSPPSLPKSLSLSFPLIPNSYKKVPLTLSLSKISLHIQESNMASPSLSHFIQTLPKPISQISQIT